MTTRSRLAVILHADVTGSTELVRRDERRAHERITGTFQAFAKQIRARGGKVREIRGDALVAEFSRASDAVCAALAFQAGAAARDAADDDEVVPRLRVGIGLGEVVVADRTVTGAGVVLARRVEQLAAPGGVCVTEAVREALPDRLPLLSESLGTQALKGFDQPVHVFSLRIVPGSKLPAPERPRWAIGARGAVSAAVVAIVVAVAVAWSRAWIDRLSQPAPEREGAASARPSVAVLPFRNHDDDSSRDYFADGLTDDLITDLSKLSGLLVIARHSVFAFRDRETPIEEVARNLGVRYVVEGSVRRSGDRIRVNAQLVDATTRRHLWAERYDRRLTDLFAVQDELVAQIASALAVRLTRREEAVLAMRPTPDLEAYELFLRARDGYFSRDQGRMRESLDLFVRATTIDPGFARAHAGLAQLAADMLRLGSVRGMAGGVARRIAEDSAREALALDPTLPDAHSVLALLHLTEARHEEALRSARRAVELDPNNADAHAVLGIVSGYAGDPAAALAAIRTAVRLNPRPPPFLTTYHGLALFLSRRYMDAISVLEPIAGTRDRGLADAPREILAMAYAEVGRLDEARAQVRSLRADEIFLNLAWYRTNYRYHARAADLEHRLGALRKAGMPEWPLGYSGDPERQVQAPALARLVTGATWRGRDEGRRTEFIQEFDAGGGVVYAGPGTLLSGRAFVLDDELCEQYEAFNRGIEFCGPVYRNTNGAGERHEYAYVNPVTLRYFSLVEQPGDR